MRSTLSGTQCDPGQVLVVAGAQRGMDFLCRMLLDPGDAAWMEEPGFPGALSNLVSAQIIRCGSFNVFV